MAEPPAKPHDETMSEASTKPEPPPPQSDKSAAPETPKEPAKKPDPDRWGFFEGIRSLLSAFPNATTGQKVAVVAMSLFAVMFIALGLVGSFALPAWAVVTMFSLGVVLIFGTLVMLLIIERKVSAPVRCQHIPIYPPDAAARGAIKAGLDEIRKAVADQLRAPDPTIPDRKIRANIFLLAQVACLADTTWKLVIHPDFAVNMNHPPELGLQFSIGQGATGVAYRDGTYQLTRRLAQPKEGEWERKFQMTPELNAQIHKDLKWIVSFPLLRQNTKQAVGVLNIDGLIDVSNDELLNTVASSVIKQVQVIADHLALQPSICIGIDQLGVLKHV